MFPWQQDQQGPGPTLAIIKAPSGKVCVLGSSRCRSAGRSLWALCVVAGTLLYLFFVLFTSQAGGLPVAAVSVLHSKAHSTLNMSLLRLSHAKGEKKGGREEVGNLLRRQIPSLFDALMLIHSERTSCLSAYTATLLCLSLCFRGFFLFPLILPHCFLQLCFLFSYLPLTYLSSLLPPSLFFLTSSPGSAFSCLLTSHQQLVGMFHRALPSTRKRFTPGYRFHIYKMKQGVAVGGSTCSADCNWLTRTDNKMKINVTLLRP